MHNFRIWIAAGALALSACGGGGTTTAGEDEHGDAHAGADGAKCSPSGTSVSVSADNTEFNTDCLAVPAGEKFTVAFDNKENVAHNFAILPKGGKGDPLFDTQIFSGPKKVTLEADPLEAGTYTFHCIVHPNMVGKFIVE